MNALSPTRRKHSVILSAGPGSLTAKTAVEGSRRSVPNPNRRPLFHLILAAAFALLATATQAQTSRPIPFDHTWLFQQSDVRNGGAPATPDSTWTTVDVPHDWAIAGPFAQTNTTGGAGAFAPAGIGWYRKHFAMPAGAANKRVFVEFDGVMANSDVWINGKLLGHRPSGYISFRYDLTDALHPGDNVLAVRADNEQQPASRWYEGAGIYRHVRLLMLDPVHVAAWGTAVSTPSVTATAASVRVRSTVDNQSTTAASVQINVALIGPSGKLAGTMHSEPQQIAPGEQVTFEATANVPNPDRWDTFHPALYRARVEVVTNGKAADSDQVAFGIREFHFDAATGFYLNGRNLKLKGVALHVDVGGLGVAAPVGAWEHRLAALRAMGANAIRTAHNPVAPEFLDLCDRMGFLVMDEMFDQWLVAKTPYDYHLYFKDWYLTDTRDTVRRDRNHPSVILWSAGNEIHDTPNAASAKATLEPMIETFHREDPTRPVTQALFRPNVSHDYDNGLADMLDVVGQNYRTSEILAAHAQKPSRKIVGTENIHDRASWLDLRDHPEYAGQFLWVGADYLGESHRWPEIGSGSGMQDRTDAYKIDGLERQSWWASTPVVHVARRMAPTPLAPTDPGYEAAQTSRTPRQTVFQDWTPRDLAPHDEQVEVYSNCPHVELFLNDKSIGTQDLPADASPRKWSVPFAPGTLRAVANDQGTNGPGNPACKGTSETLTTAGPAAKLTLTVERARLSQSFDDVAYLRAVVVDAKGIRVPDATPTLTFVVTGPGTLLATDSGNNADASGFQHPDRVAFHGNAIAIVRATAATGTVTVTVSAPILAPASVTLPITP